MSAFRRIHEPHQLQAPLLHLRLQVLILLGLFQKEVDDEQGNQSEEAQGIGSDTEQDDSNQKTDKKRINDGRWFAVLRVF